MESDEQTGERKYKIVKGLPTEHSFAKTVFDKFGIDISYIRKKANSR